MRIGPSHQAWTDRRLLLTPRDYIKRRTAFGRRKDVVMVVPEGGDAESGEAALVQHHIALLAGTAELQKVARRFGVSVSTLDRARRGERWAGQVVLSALLEAARTSPSTTAWRRSWK